MKHMIQWQCIYGDVQYNICMSAMQKVKISFHIVSFKAVRPTKRGTIWSVLVNALYMVMKDKYQRKNKLYIRHTMSKTK
uniref:Uncharacterized protein n=1 Tax=Anguilla anguilla TaxID=7936 RepID=A0A0E9WZQ9_ANGAN